MYKCQQGTCNYYIKSCTSCGKMTHKREFQLSQDHFKKLPQSHNAKFHYSTGLALRGCCNKNLTKI